MNIKYDVPFTMISTDMIQSEKFTIHQKMVYIALCSHANNSNTCFPSYKTIAREASCSRRKVILVIAELQKLGLVKVISQTTKDGKSTSNLYEISIYSEDKPVEKSADGERPAPKGKPRAPSDSASPAPYGECGAPELYSYNNINLLNKNQSSISLILENAELENFHKDDDRHLYKTVLEKMYNSKNITVDGSTIPQKVVREQLRKIDYEVMAEAHDSIRYKAVANKVGYLTSVIYNALLLKVNDDFNLEQGYQKHERTDE